jgi:hypothetical protein
MSPGAHPPVVPPDAPDAPGADFVVAALAVAAVAFTLLIVLAGDAVAIAVPGLEGEAVVPVGLGTGQALP